jgi:anti-sigma regulatory factor (Ser/Thr protein kinase)
LHVLDNGPGFRSRRKRERLPVDDWSESGRGLFIVNACAVSFTVRNRHGRGTHASATLPPA